MPFIVTPPHHFSDRVTVGAGANSSDIDIFVNADQSGYFGTAYVTLKINP
jgi:hypothetical protein